MRHKVILVPFPFDDLTGTKVRPAVCLTDAIGPHRRVTLAFITSVVPAQLEPTDLLPVRCLSQTSVATPHRGARPEISRGLRSAATIPPVDGEMVMHPGGVPEPFALSTRSGTPPGCKMFLRPGSGGVAALNPRLISVNPPGSEIGKIREQPPRVAAARQPWAGGRNAVGVHRSPQFPTKSD